MKTINDNEKTKKLDAAYQQAQQPQQEAQQTQQQTQETQQPVQQTAQQPQQVQQPAASANVANAQQLLQQGLAASGSYQSKWDEQLTGLLDQITNRKPFQYDVNADALYQMYKDQYVRQGRMAMQDTMGQAATMTGGYGNSYAQNAGQQAYQGYLQELTAKIPELAQVAQEQYNQEGQDLYNRYNLIGAERDRQQSIAQSQVDYLLSIGVRPNEDLLKNAGYDSQYIEEILNRANQPMGGGGGGSSAQEEPLGDGTGGWRRGGGYDTIAATAASAMRAGFSESDVVKGLKQNGVSDARARAAAKQARIIREYLGGSR